MGRTEEASRLSRSPAVEANFGSAARIFMGWRLEDERERSRGPLQSNFQTDGMHEPYDHQPPGIPRDVVRSRCAHFACGSPAHAKGRSEIWEMVCGPLHRVPRRRSDQLQRVSAERLSREWHFAVQVTRSRMEDGGRVLAGRERHQREGRRRARPYAAIQGTVYLQRRGIRVPQLPWIYPEHPGPPADDGNHHHAAIDRSHSSDVYLSV